MPTYTITAPDGNSYSIDGPEGATKAEVAQAVLAKNPASGQPPAGSAGFSLGDIAKSFGMGAVGSTKALTDVAGAGNVVSSKLEGATESLQRSLTPERQAEMERQAARMKAAEESGSTFQEIKAGALNVAEAPLQSAAQAIGSFVPYLLSTPVGLGMRLAGASQAAIAAVAKQAPKVIGTAQGAGAVKGAIYDGVLRAEIEAGVNPEEAKQKATAAQDYFGKNFEQIALGGALGLGAASTGVEKFLTPAGRAGAAPGVARRVGEAVVKESIPEAAQGGQERLAQNIALQREGYDVDTLKGVAGAATQEALTGALGAAPVAAISRPAAKGVAKEEQDKFEKEEAEFRRQFGATQPVAPEPEPELPTEFPGGYTATRREVERKEVPEGFGIFAEGSQTPLSKVTSQEEADAKLQTLSEIRQQEQSRLAAESEKLIADVNAEQRKLDVMEATGQTGTDEYIQAKAAYDQKAAEATQKIDGITQRIADYSAPLSVAPVGTRVDVQSAFDVKKGEEPVGTFNTLEEAQAALQQREPELFKQAEETARVETDDRIQQLEKTLTPLLAKFNLQDVGLKVVEKIKNNAGGSYLDRLIQVAIDEQNPIQTMRHESMHALKDLDFFTPQQWKVLTERANKEWIKTYLADVPVEIDGVRMSRLDAYKQMGLTQEELIEEAISDAFGAYDRGATPPPGMIAALYKKLKNFFMNFGQALRGAGFESADDVFQRVERGELNSRKPKAKTEAVQKAEAKAEPKPEAKEKFNLPSPEEGKPAEGRTYKLDIEREKRKVARSAFLTDEEQAAVNADAQKLNLTEKQTEQIIKTIKADKKRYPATQGWADLKVIGIDSKTDDDGNVVPDSESPKYAAIAYAYNVPPGATKAPQKVDQAWLKQVTGKFQSLVESIYKRAAAGDVNAQNIIAHQTWYKNVASTLRQEYGGFGDTLADLLGATSPNTPVDTNWRFSIEVMRRFVRGDFDAEMQKFVKYLDTGKSVSKYPSSDKIRQISGKLYGMNSTNAMLALADTWRAIKPGQAPKARNFALNLIGQSNMATIDVWAARMLRRAANMVPGASFDRIPPPAEQGVSGTWNADATKVTGAFGFGAEVMQNVSDNLAKKGIIVAPPDLQAIAWFAEKELWGKKGWTTKTGEGGSFEENIEAQPTERFIAGHSVQIGSDKPEQKTVLDAQKRIQAVLDRDKGVLAYRVMQTSGLYGNEVEASFDTEIVADKGQFDPEDLIMELALISKKNNQWDIFVSRVVGVNEDSPNARPGVEIYFKTPQDMAKIMPILNRFTSKGQDGFTLAVDPRAEDGTNQYIGVRLQYVPEISIRWDEGLRQKLLIPGQLERILKGKMQLLNNIVADVSVMDGVAYAASAKYDTVVIGKENYNDYIEGRVAEGDQEAGSQPWFGEPVRSHVERAVTRLQGDRGQVGEGSVSDVSEKPSAGEKYSLGARLRAYRAGDDAPQTHTQRSGGDVGRVRVLGAKPIAQYTPANSFKGVVGEYGHQSPDFYEISGKDADVFEQAIQASKNASRFGASVYVYPVEDYSKMRLFLTEDGKSGFALKDDDIVSVFSGSPHKGSVHSSIQLAVQEGGRRLDAFDTVLGDIYNTNGFQVVGRMKWNEDYKPDNWDKETFAKFNDGEPDVVYMSYDPDDNRTISENPGKYFDDPDELAQAQRDAVTAYGDRATKLSLRTSFPTAKEAEDAAYNKAPPSTKEFKQFFGASTIMDEGRPQPMYHGSASGFDAFSEAKPIFISPDPDFAEQFAEDRAKDEGKSSDEMRIYPLWVRAETPFDYENKEHAAMVAEKIISDQKLATENSAVRLKKSSPKVNTFKKELAGGLWSTIEDPVVQDALKSMGFDSFYVQEQGNKNLAVFKAEQVKSITGNIGDFSLESKNMRFSLKKVRYSPDRFQKLWDDSMYTPNDAENKTKGYLAFVNPMEFVRALASPDMFERLRREQEPLDFEKMRAYAGIPSLTVLEKNGNWKITGHEGRHRMLALYDAGYREVPVYIHLRADDAQSIPVKTLTAQYDDAVSSVLMAAEVEPLSYANKQKALEKFTRMESKVKYSLPSIPAQVSTRIGETTTRREEKGWIQNLMEAITPTSAAQFRAQNLNRYNQMSVYDKAVTKKMGGVKLLAEQSAEMGALMSDLGGGISASAMGIGDRSGGIPVFRNGITTIDRRTKGLVASLAPLAAYNDPTVYQRYQYWAMVKRGVRLNREGKDTGIDTADVAFAKLLEQKHPEFVSVQKDLIAFNNGLVQYMVDTGVLSKERGYIYTKHADYIPFYRQMDGENTVGPNLFQSLSGVKPPKALKGKDAAEAPIADFLETMVRNTQSAIQAGVKNAAAQRAIGVATQVQEPGLGATRLKVASTAPNVINILEKGQIVSYETPDPLLINAMMSLNQSELPFMGIISAPANLLRTLVTKEPGFMMANLVRDSLSAWVTSGVSMTPIAGTVINFGKALVSKSPGFEALMDAGILGGYEFSANVEQSGLKLQKDLEFKAGKRAPIYLRPFTSVWDALEKGTTASDAATRVLVYERVLAETGNEAEALSRALEVMNFHRKGSSPLIRVLTAAVPFFNARLQGLDLFYRASTGNMNNKDSAAIQRQFFVRGMTMMALSVAYWFAVSDDEEYQKQEQETRDNNWIIPAIGAKIPIPFEVGVLFKLIPERIAAYTFGNDTGQDLKDSMFRSAMSTFAFNPVPQAVKPVFEAAYNFNTFTWRPIVGQGMEDIAPQFQTGPGTSNVSNAIGKALGLSPMKVDHVIKGYTGTLGMYGIDVLDAVMDQFGDSPKPSKRFEQLPVFKRFMVDPEARGNVTQYYQLKDAVDTVVRTMNLLEKTGESDEYLEYLEQNMGTFAVKDYVSDTEKVMKRLREAKVSIRSSSMTADEKRDALTEIGQAENAITSQIQEIKKMIADQ